MQKRKLARSLFASDRTLFHRWFPKGRRARHSALAWRRQILVLILAACYSTAWSAQELFCGGKKYFPSDTAFEAILDEGSESSFFDTETSEDYVLSDIPPQLNNRFTELEKDKNQPRIRQRLELLDTTTFTLPGKVFQSPGELLVEDPDSLTLQHEGGYYRLDRAKKTALQARLQVGSDVRFSNFELDKNADIELSLDADGQRQAKLLKGSGVRILFRNPRSFKLKLTRGISLLHSVDRISRSMLLVEKPIRTSPQGTFFVQMRKRNEDFADREFVACVRPVNAQADTGFSQIRNVELLDPEPGKIRLTMRLPKSIIDKGEFNLWYLGTPIELQVISSKKGEPAEDRIAGQVQYVMGSSRWSFALALFAMLVVYIVPLWVLRAQREPAAAGRGTLNLGVITISRNKGPGAFPDMEALGIAGVSAPPAWFSPLWLGRNRQGGASLSSFQITIWTYLVFGVAIYVFFLNGQLINIPDNILYLLGIGGVGSVAARFTAARKDEKVELVLESGTRTGARSRNRTYPTWQQLISSAGQVDIARLQMLIFTLLAGLYVGITASVTFEFPTIPDGLLWLMGISNGLYVFGKAAEPSLANRLLEIDLQKRAASSKREGLENQLSQLRNKLKAKKAEVESMDQQLSEATTEVDTQRLADKREKAQADVSAVEESYKALEATLKQAMKDEQEIEARYAALVKKLNQTLEKAATATE